MGSAMTSDCLVVGGGIIGLSLAYELAGRGLTVTIVEQGDWGGQASAAAAGILGPLQEFDQPGPLLELGLASLALYPQWVDQLRELTGIDAQLGLEGIMRVAMNEQELDQFRERYNWQKAEGCRVEWLDQQQLRQWEPMIASDARGAIFSPDEGHVSNQLLLQALAAACRKRGVRMLAGTVAIAPVISGGRVLGMETTTGVCHAAETIIAAGAWASVIGQWLGLQLPIRPVRGQVAAVSSESVQLRRVIFGASGYLVPKKDGRIIIGATEDEAGFRRGVTLAGLAKVLNGVLPYVPNLQQADFLTAWSGLRPATADGLPLLGPLPGWEGIAVASGHFRNGILLSPVTAKWMADYVTGGERHPLRPFLPERFSA
ncbi:glycine oxidase ThiO [Brevibacillus humidisoli]|uniref:glycine oxidase ThiO n=1 Tax=Brevibacillus humidisoli TaxID=2895522 RepID=UPI001E53DCA9|nr:glycine oxidase ThiO [Brevibacillus humidisoli]UFJ41194.1 glycine oxidase ThiO [Brevibacillus humidisoli]